MDLAEQRLAAGRIEVVEDVGEQHEVVARAVVDLEGAPGERLEAVRDPSRARVLLGHREDVLPVDGDDLGLRVVSGERDAEEAVTGRDVQHLPRPPRGGVEQAGEQLRHQTREGRHRARELDPHGMVRGEPLVADRRAAGAHGGGELREAAHHVRRGDEVDRRGDAAGRAPVEEHRGDGRERVAAPVLAEEAVHHQVVREDPYPSFGCVAARGDLLRRRGAGAEGGEQVDLDRRPQRLRLLVRREGLEDGGRAEHGFGALHDAALYWRRMASGSHLAHSTRTRTASEAARANGSRAWKVCSPGVSPQRVVYG